MHQEDCRTKMHATTWIAISKNSWTCFVNKHLSFLKKLKPSKPLQLKRFRVFLPPRSAALMRAVDSHYAGQSGTEGWKDCGETSRWCWAVLRRRGCWIALPGEAVWAARGNIVCVKARGAALSFVTHSSRAPLAFLPSFVFKLRSEAETTNYSIPRYSNELLDGYLTHPTQQGSL